jgi:hypothetical protein
VHPEPYTTKSKPHSHFSADRSLNITPHNLKELQAVTGKKRRDEAMSDAEVCVALLRGNTHASL